MLFVNSLMFLTIAMRLKYSIALIGAEPLTLSRYPFKMGAPIGVGALVLSQEIPPLLKGGLKKGFSCWYCQQAFN